MVLAWCHHTFSEPYNSTLHPQATNTFVVHSDISPPCDNSYNHHHSQSQGIIYYIITTHGTNLPSPNLLPPCWSSTEMRKTSMGATQTSRTVGCVDLRSAVHCDHIRGWRWGGGGQGAALGTVWPYVLWVTVLDVFSKFNNSTSSTKGGNSRVSWGRGGTYSNEEEKQYTMFKLTWGEKRTD